MTGVQTCALPIYMRIEEPKHPDLILENDGGRTPEEQVEKIFFYCVS